MIETIINYFRFGGLEQYTFIFSSYIGQKSRCLSLLFALKITVHKINVSAWLYFFQNLWRESASKLIQFIVTIYFHIVGRLGYPFPFWLLVRSHFHLLSASIILWDVASIFKVSCSELSLIYVSNLPKPLLDDTSVFLFCCKWLV